MEKLPKTVHSVSFCENVSRDTNENFFFFQGLHDACKCLSGSEKIKLRVLLSRERGERGEGLREGMLERGHIYRVVSPDDL